MGLDGDLYRLVKVLHVLAAIVGFGAAMANSVYGLQARKRRGSEGLAVAESMYHVTQNWSMWWIYSVPVTGILLILLSDDVFKFSDTWISLSFVLYIALLGIAHAVAFPNARRMIELGRELSAGAPPPSAQAVAGPPPQVAEMEERGKRAMMIGGVMNLLLVAVLFLMIFKPGSPAGL